MTWELAWFDADGTQLEIFQSTKRRAIDAMIDDWLGAKPASRIYVYRLRHGAEGGHRVSVLERIVTTEQRSNP